MKPASSLRLGVSRTCLCGCLKRAALRSRNMTKRLSSILKTLAKPTEKAYTTYPYLMLEAERQAAEIMLMQHDPNLTKADLQKKENAPL